mgnify:CR=1 FL=1
MSVLISKYHKIFSQVPESDPATLKAYLILHGGASWSDLAVYYTKYSLSVLFMVVPPHVLASLLGVGLTVALNQAFPQLSRSPIATESSPEAGAPPAGSPPGASAPTTGSPPGASAPTTGSEGYLEGTYSMLSELVSYV